MKNELARPFVKWAGGKSQLLNQIECFYPKKLINGNITRYVEPFLGGGAVFFELNKKFSFETIVLNDINEELIMTYKVVRDTPQKLINELFLIQEEYMSNTYDGKEKMYYKIRDEYNYEKSIIDYKSNSDSWTKHAAKLIFLNKTCFNGLYRLNKKGEFNVPFGKRKSINLCDEENIINVSKALQGVMLLSCDFEELTEYINSNTFVYLDPPYKPINETSSFNDYAKSSFDDASQRRLVAWYVKMHNKGASLMLSNSDPTNYDEKQNFFQMFYRKFTINTVQAMRMINSRGDGRGAINELLITNEEQLERGMIISMENESFEYKKDNETFAYLMETLKDSIKGWDYFVNWYKVNENVRDIEIELNMMNYLIGKSNVKEELAYLIKRHPNIIRIIPILVACREMDFEILNPTESNMFNTVAYSFEVKREVSEEQIKKVVEFAESTGVLQLLENKTIKNLVDYVFGIEVGLDSNGRKNRSGTSMENLVEKFVKKVCEKHSFSYLAQATPKTIKENWGYNVTVDKTARSFDFAINTGKQLYLIETNYYGGGGSKLKATAGEYKTLYDVATKDGHEFIWITDGKGWLTANRPLQEAFEHNKYILNLKMVEQGILEEILTG